MTLSPLALEDVEALYLGPSFLMADPLGPLLDQDEEEALSPSSSLEGKASASPSLSFSSYTPSPSPYHTLSSPPSCVSPPPSPPPASFLGTKARVDSPSLPWLAAGDLLDSQVGADIGEADDAFVDMDWMTEKIDLSEFDLDSLIDSCSSDESPSSPEDLLASLDSHMDLDFDSFDTTIPVLHDSLDLGASLPSIPPLPLEIPLPVATEAKKTHQEMVLKSEPPSPASLELGSEVDVLDAEKTDPSGSIENSSSFILSLPTSGHIVMMLTNKNQLPVAPSSDQSSKMSPSSSDCDSDSGIESVSGSPPRLPSPPPTSSPTPTADSSRTKPYSKAEPTTVPPAAKTSRIKSVSGSPRVVEKKVKKMEQNKTAATRYRQKKRVEQEMLSTELEELDKRNRELTEKAESISREIQYLKDLMEEVRKHRHGKSSSEA